MAPTKVKLVLESLVLFAEKGFDGISVRDIADSVSLQTSSLYNHFKSKMELLDFVIQQSEDLYYLYLNGLTDRLENEKTFPGILDTISRDPKVTMNACAIYAISLIHREKYRNMCSARIYTHTFIEGSVDFYNDILTQAVDNGLCQPFDTKTASIMINNAFHTVVSLAMQEYLGFTPVTDYSEMFEGVKAFILKQAYPEYKDRALEPNGFKLPPFPREMAAFTPEEPEGYAELVSPILELLPAEVRVAFTSRIESYLRTIETECVFLTQFKLGDEAESVFKSFTDSYIKSTAAEAADLSEVLEARKIIEAQAELWRLLKGDIQKKVRAAQLRLQDMFSVLLKIDEEYTSAFRRQNEGANGLGRTIPLGAPVIAPDREPSGETYAEAVALNEAGDRETDQSQVGAPVGKPDLAAENQAASPTKGVADESPAFVRPWDMPRPGFDGARRKPFGRDSFRGTDHENLDVLVKVNGKLVKRPNPRIEPTLQKPPVGETESGDAQRTAARAAAGTVAKDKTGTAPETVAEGKVELDLVRPRVTMWAAMGPGWVKR
ncbi:MAG: TetR/AcrR family transcriptional regulator [Deltaproteobacteria bacterium]|jgi:AcrR family transcriptional regulator|nr:TetR/AcrR family transcriptional regulator [Deltaproteobacteria bacterium]